MRVLLYFTAGAIRGHFAAAVLALKIALFKMSPNGSARSVLDSASCAENASFIFLPLWLL